MNRTIPTKSYFTTSTDVTKSYIGISIGQQVQQLQMTMQTNEQQQKVLNLHKQDLMNIMKDYIAQSITRVTTIDKLNELHDVVDKITSA